MQFVDKQPGQVGVLLEWVNDQFFIIALFCVCAETLPKFVEDGNAKDGEAVFEIGDDINLRLEVIEPSSVGQFLRSHYCVRSSW